MLALARHAEAVKNVRGDIIGGNGTGLTDAGALQAEELAVTLSSLGHWDAIYCSEQPQCVESLNVILAKVSAPCMRLSIPKYVLGAIEGMETEELARSMPEVAARFALWRIGEIDITALALPGADDPESYYARGVEFLDQLPVNQNSVVLSTRSVLVLLYNALTGRSPASGNYREVPWRPAQLRVFDHNREMIHDVRYDA